MSLNTSKSTSVTDALNSRITVRQFLDKPVPKDVLNKVLTMALYQAKEKTRLIRPIHHPCGNRRDLGAIN